MVSNKREATLIVRPNGLRISRRESAAPESAK
jgi:hypothetical protein